MASKWKKYEDETHRVISKFNPRTKVYKDVRISGKFSLHKRQVDVQMLIDSEQLEFIAFECKDHRRSIDVEKVEQFNTKLQDIGAKKGAIVSNSPFTKAAVNTASALDIELLHLINTRDQDIQIQMYAPAILSDISVKSFHLGLGISSSSESFTTDTEKIILVDQNGHRHKATSVFKKLWDEDIATKIEKPGYYKYTVPPKGIKIVSSDGKEIKLTRLEFKYQAEIKYFLGEIKLEETEGLYDVKEKTFQTNDLTTEKIIPSEIEKAWKEITFEEAKQCKVFIQMRVVSLFENDESEKIDKEH